VRKESHHEQQAAEELGEAMGLEGRRQPASGAIRGHKGDGCVLGHWLFEHKETGKLSFALKLDELKKIEQEAYERGEEDLLVFRFNIRYQQPQRYVVRRGQLDDPDHTIVSKGKKQIRLNRDELRYHGSLCNIVFRDEAQKYYITPWESFLEEVKRDRYESNPTPEGRHD